MISIFKSVVLCAACLFGSMASAEVITNSVGYIGNSVSPFAETDTATYGQTFTVGSDNRLDSFTLSLLNLNGPSLAFHGYVYAWDGVKASGAQLYRSATQYLTTSSSTPAAYTFDTSGIVLTSGGNYVLFLSTSESADTEDSSASMPIGGSISDSYAGGSFVYFNNGNDFGALTSSPWNQSFSS